MTIEAVIVDYRAILRSSHHLNEVRDLLNWFLLQGLELCVFTTDPLNVGSECAQFGLPVPSLHVHRANIPGNKNRGSDLWIDVAAGALSVPPHKLFYIGTSNRDWRTAINSGVMFCHAGWTGPQPPGTTCLVCPTAGDVKNLVGQYLLESPRWSYALDHPSNSFTLRSLLPARARLPKNLSGGTFQLQDVFTYSKTITVGSEDARDLLGFHVISSIYLEGRLSRGAYFCVYPGSSPGKISPQLAGYVRPAASLVHGFYKEDLLVRAVQAPDTSLARWRATQAGTTANISIATQANTVHVNAKYASGIAGRTVVVFDDFTTAGMSLEWARIALLAAGASDVVALTVGKYGQAVHTEFFIASAAKIDPFNINGLSDVDFAQKTVPLRLAGGNEARMAALFERHLRGSP